MYVYNCIYIYVCIIPRVLHVMVSLQKKTILSSPGFKLGDLATIDVGDTTRHEGFGPYSLVNS